jgi:UDP:flavonoid glycosyltransferase YjiC (YdhE family)
MLEIARVARRTFDCVLISYDGAVRKHVFITAEGFPVRALEPVMTPEKVAHFWAVDRGDKLGDILSVEDVRGRVRAEVALYREVSAAAVVTGFCLSTPLSARAARVPLVWVSQGTWVPEYAEAYATWPDALDHPVTRALPSALLDKIARRLTRTMGWVLSRPFDRVSRELGLGPLRGHALLEGDHTLFAEPPGFSDIAVPRRLEGRHRFIGPLPARLPLPVPPAVEALPRDLPLVFFAMGSSGKEAVVRKILQGFAAMPCRVIAPVQELLQGRVEVPPNVLLTGWLPSDKVNPLCAVSVIHGGIGTVMTACLSGTPIVGIPNGLVEQEYNLDCVVRKGFGVRLRYKRFTPEDVLREVDRFLRDEGARARALAYRDELRRWDGPERAARFLEETLGG